MSCENTKILITGDLWRPFPSGDLGNQDSNIETLYRLINQPLGSLPNVKVDLWTSKTAPFELKDNYATPPSELEWANLWASSAPPGGHQVIAALSKFDIIIGYELPSFLMQLMDRHNITYICFELAPIRFLKDTFFACLSNNPELQKRLMELEIFNISPLSTQTASLITATIHNRDRHYDSTFSNSLIFLGQTEVDKSIIHNNRFAKFEDFKDKILTLCQGKKSVYVKPHPYSNESVNQLRKIRPDIKITNEHPYSLFSKYPNATFVTLSSSLYHEAEYFGASCHRLIPQTFSTTFPPVSIGICFFDTNFWKYLLFGKGTPQRTQLGINDLRWGFGPMWGYEHIDGYLRQLNDSKTFTIKQTEELTKLREYTYETEKKLEELTRMVHSQNNFIRKLKKYSGYAALNNAFRLLRPIPSPPKDSKDFSFESGERQTSGDLKQIRRDHLVRYELAANIINEKKCSSVLDVFCGNGYGSFLLATTTNCTIKAIDGSSEAISFAKEHYNNHNISFESKIFPFQESQSFDFIVSLESIEHIDEDCQFLKMLYDSLVPGGYLLLSTPNEEALDLKINPNHFHFRHYTIDSIREMLQKNNFSLISFWGQNTYELDSSRRVTGLLSDLLMGLDLNDATGQFQIYLAQKNFNED